MSETINDTPIHPHAVLFKKIATNAAKIEVVEGKVEGVAGKIDELRMLMIELLKPVDQDKTFTARVAGLLGPVFADPWCCRGLVLACVLAAGGGSYAVVDSAPRAIKVVSEVMESTVLDMDDGTSDDAPMVDTEGNPVVEPVDGAPDGESIP